LILLCGSFTTKAAQYEKIRSMDDFYVKLSNQIFSHEVDKYYEVPDYDIVKTIMSMSMEDYEYHYDENNPLISGCYLSHYITYMNLYYRNGNLRVVIQFKYSKSEMDEHFAMMSELSKELKCDTDYDTVQNVHDYLIKNFEYDKKTIYVNHTDIDGFKDNQMVCSGYSLAAYYLLNAVGIPTRVITGYGGVGTSDERNHMWNMVELDGKWYNMDITWDDTNGERPTYNYFLKNDDDFTEHIRLGKYDIAYFSAIVAKKSYKLPAKLKLGEFGWYVFMVAVLLLGMFISSVIINKKRRKKEKEVYRIISAKPMNEEFDMTGYTDKEQ
ncbi:MAG: hypothetical protein IJ054_02950, partial [Lachnospiraceae bacterium]|nr:hypothetical protein [Lachnospiraceae bacterium]